MHLNIKVKILTPLGKVPEKGTKWAAGYDLFAAEQVVVPRLGRKLIKTNVSLEIPENHYGELPRDLAWLSRRALMFWPGLLTQTIAAMLESFFSIPTITKTLK